MSNLPSEPDAPWTSEVEEPDVTNIVIEDDEPVDNIYSEKQQRLLTEPLYSSWAGPVGPDGELLPFLATANVGVFATPDDPPLVPDVLVSSEVRAHPDLPHDKRHQTYFVWKMGKPPDVVIEIVSNKKGGEHGKRKRGYERMRVIYFVVWDPELILGERELVAYVLGEDGYLPMTRPVFSRLSGLELRPWEGSFEQLHARWLRWFVGETLIPTGAERAAVAEERAAVAEQRAAEAEERAARLAELLAQHGIAGDGTT